MPDLSRKDPHLALTNVDPLRPVVTHQIDVHIPAVLKEPFRIGILVVIRTLIQAAHDLHDEIACSSHICLLFTGGLS